MSAARTSLYLALPAKSGLDPVTSAPAEFGGFLRAGMKKWASVIREANIRVQ